MSDDDVFDRRWLLAEDELLRMLWRCHAGENPDVLLVELHANRRSDRRNPGPFGARTPKSSRQKRHRVVH